MPDEIELNAKEQSVIAVGASVAAGCQPCTAYHVKEARTAGVCERSIQLAVEVAVSGRNHATVLMDDWAARCQGSRPAVDDEFRMQKRLILELTAIATAVAVNSVADLQLHLDAARLAGASTNQILFAIQAARKIKRVAEEKVDAIANGIEGQGQPAATAAGAACCGSAQPAAPEGARGARSSCGCR